MPSPGEHSDAGVKGNDIGVPLQQLPCDDSGTSASITNHLVGETSRVRLEDGVDPVGIRRASCVVFRSCTVKRPHVFMVTLIGERVPVQAPDRWDLPPCSRLMICSSVTTAGVCT